MKKNGFSVCERLRAKVKKVSREYYGVIYKVYFLPSRRHLADVREFKVFRVSRSEKFFVSGAINEMCKSMISLKIAAIMGFLEVFLDNDNA